MVAEAKASVDSLLKSEASFDRAFGLLVGAVFAELGWLVCWLVLELFDVGWARVVSGVLTVAMLGAYGWFAVAVGRAAACLGKTGWFYATWVIVAPILAIGIGVVDLSTAAALLGLAPLHLKFGGVLIGVSPLSVRFLLASQLRSEIHDRTFAD